MRRIFQPNITIRSVRLYYQTQLTPGTRNTTHQVTARHNKKAIGQYKPMDCITHISFLITSRHCTVYPLSRSASDQQSILYSIYSRHNYLLNCPGRSQQTITEPKPNRTDNRKQQRNQDFIRKSAYKKKRYMSTAPFVILYLICS